MAQDTHGGKEDLLLDTPIHQFEAEKQHRHLAAWAGLLVFALGAFVTVGTGGMGNFLASVLPTKPVPAFDGTALPVEKAPNWVKLRSEEYKYAYEQLASDKLTDFPQYVPGNLDRDVATLKWGNPSDDAIRNQKITYSVPYMGSYRLNGKEYDGSHLAIDLKVPNNTPVRSIANGIVVKVATPSSGFGMHLVVEHRDVPSFDNAAVKTTYYSSYSHLGSILVAEGDVVLRGQNIALSGHSGFATTPHIHFQIDKNDAPWHPFWPFTFQDQSAAGLDFVGALNAGLGKEKAIANTINPMLYVQQYLTSSEVVTPSLPAAPVEPAPAPTPVATPTASNGPVFSLAEKTSFQLGDEVSFTVNVKDSNGNIMSSFENSALLLLSGDVGTLSQINLASSDFSDGKFTVKLLAPRVGHGVISVFYHDVSVAHLAFDIATPVAVSAPTPPSVPKPIASNKPKIFADVGGSTPYYDAIEFMKQKSVFGGYSDGTFRPDQVISRVEVLKVALKSSNRPLLQTTGTLSYSDIDASAWYVPYIATAQQNGIMQGYVGGYFRPNQNVTRAEFLKILLLSSPVSIDPTVAIDPFTDVKKDDWYAVFAQFAKTKNLLPKSGTEFKPNEEITRGEVAEIIYRLMVILQSGAGSYLA
jgi:murein DD-endopeptidase MepM/ murein hydrolase activator NlpD